MINENAEQFWESVKILTKENKTKQEFLAEKCGVSLGVFKAWVFNKRLPDASQSVRIAKSLGTSVEYLVTGQKEKQGNTEVSALLKKALELLEN